jgi:molybdopterin molybdotransferase
MISVKEADVLLQEHLLTFLQDYCPIEQCLGQVLVEPLRADRDFPPFNRVTMDGIAISHSGDAQAEKEYIVQAIQLAGEAPLQLISDNHCIEIMTGSVCPQGCDTIIPKEEITFSVEKDVRKATIHSSKIINGQNIHKVGSDAKRGSLLLNQKTIITPSILGLLASLGKTSVKVFMRPGIAIVSTGNELVEIDKMPLPHQIRRSNAYMIQTALHKTGFKSKLFHFNDDKDLLKKGLSYILDNFQIVISSGAVSKGVADFLPEVFSDIGVNNIFHFVAQKPGKPFYFGKRNNQAVFALPGNPVSTYMCFIRYVLPYLYHNMGIESHQKYAVLTEDLVFNAPLSFFPTVVLRSNLRGILEATPIRGNGSGDLVQLVEADAFIELEQGKTHFKKDESFKVYPF